MLNHLKNLFHIFESIVADIVFGFPGRKIKLIGVTGTDGKTTTVHLIYYILRSSGIKTSMISSIYADIGGKISDTGFHTTTPRSWVIRKYLRQAVRAGSQYFILETTSHALSQNRVWGLDFSFGVLTNITCEHLYHHKSFDDYFNSKMKLLLNSDTIIINKDGEVYERIAKILDDNNKHYITYSLTDKNSDITWNKIISTNLIGAFNHQNILAAYLTCRQLNISEKVISDAIASFQLPKGRFDTVFDKDFKVIIDFAHTPNSFEQILLTITQELLTDNGKLIHVFGAASQRDDSKRIIMGQVSSKYSDYIILTEEDYRKEDFNQICSQIEEGITDFNKVAIEEFLTSVQKNIYTIVKDRAEAIQLAIKKAGKGDVVLLTGKAHEKSLNRNGREVPWDEYEIVSNALLNI